jgi:hypothetical protein
VERVDFAGKPARAVEYVFPLDLVTDIPASALKTTEAVEQAKNYRMTKRKRWILVDALLPPVHPFVPPQPAPARKTAPKRASKPARKPGKPASGR